MVFKIVAGIGAFAISSIAFSAVTLSVPEEIKIVAINDQEIGTNFLRSNNKIKLNAGTNVISVRYSGYYQHPDNSHDILKSGVVTVKTPALTDGNNYSLALINPPQDFDQAEKYKDEPIIGLYDQNKQLLVQQAGAKASKSWLSSVFSDSDTLDATQIPPQAHQPAPIYTSQTTQATLNPNVSTQTLIQSWQHATKQERQAFMTWLAEQSN